MECWGDGVMECRMNAFASLEYSRTSERLDRSAVQADARIPDSLGTGGLDAPIEPAIAG